MARDTELIFGSWKVWRENVVCSFLIRILIFRRLQEYYAVVLRRLLLLPSFGKIVQYLLTFRLPWLRQVWCDSSSREEETVFLPMFIVLSFLSPLLMFILCSIPEEITKKYLRCLKKCTNGIFLVKGCELRQRRKCHLPPYAIHQNYQSTRAQTFIIF